MLDGEGAEAACNIAWSRGAALGSRDVASGAAGGFIGCQPVTEGPSRSLLKTSALTLGLVIRNILKCAIILHGDCCNSRDSRRWPKSLVNCARHTRHSMILLAFEQEGRSMVWLRCVQFEETLMQQKICLP